MVHDAAPHDPAPCAVCPQTTDLIGIMVAGLRMVLCADHHAQLGFDHPKRFDDFSSFFSTPGINRRARSDRRERERRDFPRPEGRRANMGRRLRDPDA